MNPFSRRRFIRTSFASAVGLGLTSPLVRASASPSLFGGLGNSILGANDKVRFGIVGSGGRGQSLMKTFLENEKVDCAVICDVDDAMIAEALKLVEEKRENKPDVVKDFRRVVDRDDVDVVVVGTPDHWHALPTIYACEAGKDVYVEKPLATSIGEGRAMVDCARKYDRVVQMGTQWKSGSHFKDAIAYVHSGKLGKIRQVRCWAYLTWIKGPGNPQDCAPPEGVDYDLWLGPAPKVPFNPARFHFTFRWFWDYAGGLMTDWGVHLINLAMWGMDFPQPLTIASTGGRYMMTDLMETPDTQQAIYEFPDFALIWEHQMQGGYGPHNREHGVAFYGKEGTLVLDANGWEVVPEKDKSLEPEKHEGDSDTAQTQHVENFLDCIRTRERPVEDVELGHRMSAVAHLGNLAFRTNSTIQWDPEKEQVKGNWEANRLVTQSYRSPWNLPSLAKASPPAVKPKADKHRPLWQWQRHGRSR